MTFEALFQKTVAILTVIYFHLSLKHDEIASNEVADDQTHFRERLPSNRYYKDEAKLPDSLADWVQILIQWMQSGKNVYPQVVFWDYTKP